MIFAAFSVAMMLLATFYGSSRIVVSPDPSLPQARPPIPRSSPAKTPDVVEGLPIETRKEIAAEHHRLGMLASYEAEHQYPTNNFKAMSKDPASQLQKHQDVYESRKEEAFRSLAEQYSITREQLEHIDSEAFHKKWPLPDPPNPYR